jgi:1A family penicillin-binding protein
LWSLHHILFNFEKSDELRYTDHMSSQKDHQKKFFDTIHQAKHHAMPHIVQQTRRARTSWEKFKIWLSHHMQLILWITATITLLLVGAFFIWVGTLKIPTLDNFAERKVVSSTKIYDRTGEVVLYDVHENVKRTVVVGESIDLKIKNAAIAIEDKDFYSHNGIKISSTIRAVLVNLTPLNGTQGGSTITQQIIKNTLLNTDKRISRKIKEWILALKLERVMTKDQILTLYLNEAPYGGSVYGVEEAARMFFGKSSIEVTTAEAAYLAAIPNAPTYYSPYGKNKDRLDNRKNLVLQKMLEQGYISRDEYVAAKEEQIVFKPLSDSNGKALHFVDYIRAYLEETYGKDALLVDGLKVTTTLDWKLQEQAEKIVNENALKNEKDWNATNSALVVIDPKTGQILSMIGSREYSDPDIDGQFNVATATRQPGSAFKPIIYARAFEKGYRPETTVFDVPTQFTPSCGAFSRESGATGCYAPDNYDGKFLGPISLRSALGQSRNVPAVKMLYLVGVGDALQTAKQLGITTLDKNFDRYGLTLVLGGGEVSLLELTSVYGVFANDGVKLVPTGILKIEDVNGKILEEYKQKGEQVMSPDAAHMLSSILSDNVARTPLFGANSLLNFGDRPVAVKSGTTNDNKDAWMVGYTPDVAVGVWTGNNDNKPMKKGSAISAPAWRAVMDLAVKDKPKSGFGSYSDPVDTTPPVIRGLWWGGESFFVDKLSGKLATEYTPRETKQEYVITNPHNILYWVNKNDLNNSRAGIGMSDGQYKNWEAAFQNWIQTHGLGNIPAIPEKPTQTDDIHLPALSPVVTVTQPTTGSSYNINESVSITVFASGPQPVQKIEYYINDQFIGLTDGSNGSYQFIPADYVSSPGSATLKVIAVDTIYNKGTQSIELLIQ